MAMITPKFDFTAAIAMLGEGQMHTSAQTAENNLAPIKFNEYERVMISLCKALGNMDLTDIDVLKGSAQTVESVFRTLTSAYGVKFSSLDSAVASYQSSIIEIDSEVTTNFTQMTSLVEQERTDRTVAIQTLQSSVNALQLVVSSSSSSVNTQITDFMAAITTDINTIKSTALFKPTNAGAQTIECPVVFSNALSVTGGNAIDFANSSVRSTAVADINSDLMNLLSSDNRYIKKQGNGSVNGDFEITGRLKGGLPVGTVMMYDGSDWTDNITIPGWYACIYDNSDHGCPNLVGKFIMGRDKTGAGGFGGSSTVILETTNLPSHTHAIDHTHAAHTHTSDEHSHNISGSKPYSVNTTADILTSSTVISVSSNEHTHSGTIIQPEFTSDESWDIVSGSGGSYVGYDLSSMFVSSGNVIESSNDILTRSTDVKITLDQSDVELLFSPHSHTIPASCLTGVQTVTVNFADAGIDNTTVTLQSTAVTYSGVSGAIGTATPFTIEPSNYSIIFIRRCE